MELKHTPGPWKAKGGYILGADGYPVANITYVSKIDSINKKLILAVPDLLGAALMAYYFITSGMESNKDIIIRQLDEAISKATT